MQGRIHSVQSLGAVDGPGVRFVAFLQGCPLRCVYCHNPDTWQVSGGTEVEAEALVRQALRYRSYWGADGGVTLSGGEPLWQSAFTQEVFERLHAEGVHTALDTSGVGRLADAERVLQHTDLVLCDLKFLTQQDYMQHCGAALRQVEQFLQLTAFKRVPLWVRHVVVPGLTDSVEHLRLVREKARSYPNLKKLEFLPFHKLCIEKYDQMGLDFPLRDTPAMDDAWLKRLLREAFPV